MLLQGQLANENWAFFDPRSLHFGPVPDLVFGPLCV